MYKYLILCFVLSSLPFKLYAVDNNMGQRKIFGRVVLKENNQGKVENLEKQENHEKQEKTYNAISKIGGSPSLFKGVEDNIKQYELKSKKQQSERRLDNSKEKLKERLQKSKENFEKREGLTIEEADKFYSNNLNQEKNKPLKLVKDPLDKQN